MIGKIQGPNHLTPSAGREKSAADPFKEVAKGMERQFLEFMIAKMRDTVGKDEPDSSELDYYNSLLDSHYAQIISDQNGGIGIQDLILKKITPKKYPSPEMASNIPIYNEKIMKGENP